MNLKEKTDSALGRITALIVEFGKEAVYKASRRFYDRAYELGKKMAKKAEKGQKKLPKKLIKAATIKKKK